MIGHVVARCVCFAAESRLWGTRWRLSGWAKRGLSCPVFYGPVGISTAAMCRIKLASGQAAAKSEPDARGHLDHAGIEFQKPQPGGLDPSAGTALLVPGFCPVVCLGEASQAGFLVECAAGANVVGGFIDTPVEHGVAGQAKDEVDPVL